MRLLILCHMPVTMSHSAKSYNWMVHHQASKVISYQSRRVVIARSRETEPGHAVVPSDLLLFPYAHFPSSAIRPAPRSMHTIMKANLLLSFVLMGLNRKSLASNSTRPV